MIAGVFAAFHSSDIAISMCAAKAKEQAKGQAFCLPLF